jgi:hypothetical protein
MVDHLRQSGDRRVEYAVREFDRRAVALGPGDSTLLPIIAAQCATPEVTVGGNSDVYLDRARPTMLHIEPRGELGIRTFHFPESHVRGPSGRCHIQIAECHRAASIESVRQSQR